jgi:hypothetical protein
MDDSQPVIPAILPVIPVIPPLIPVILPVIPVILIIDRTPVQRVNASYKYFVFCIFSLLIINCGGSIFPAAQRGVILPLTTHPRVIFSSDGLLIML